MLQQAENKMCHKMLTFIEFTNLNCLPILKCLIKLDKKSTLFSSLAFQTQKYMIDSVSQISGQVFQLQCECK